MKKSFLRLSIVAACLSIPFTVQAAAPTAELKVKGEVTVPSCNIVAPDGGVYDFGKIAVDMIKATSMTTISEKTKTWTVNCEAETYLSFSVIDNRADSASSSSNLHFGLGHVNDTGRIGFYSAVMSAPKVDGNAAKLFSTASGSETFGVADAINITKQAGVQMGWASAANTLKSGQVFSADITVKPVLATISTMGGPLTDTVNFNGLMTMKFAFGL